MENWRRAQQYMCKTSQNVNLASSASTQRTAVVGFMSLYWSFWDLFILKRRSPFCMDYFMMPDRLLFFFFLILVFVQRNQCEIEWKTVILLFKQSTFKSCSKEPIQSWLLQSYTTTRLTEWVSHEDKGASKCSLHFEFTWTQTARIFTFPHDFKCAWWKMTWVYLTFYIIT